MKLLLSLVPYFAFYGTVWVVVRVVTALVRYFCERCELSCVEHINMLGNVFAFMGLLTTSLMVIERAHPAWSLLWAVASAVGVHLLSRKLRPIAK